MVLVWQMVPSAAGMLVVIQRLLLLMHQSSLQTSCVCEWKRVKRKKNIWDGETCDKRKESIKRDNLFAYDQNPDVRADVCLVHLPLFSLCSSASNTWRWCFNCVHVLWPCRINNNESIKQFAVPDVRSLWTRKTWLCNKVDAIKWRYDVSHHRFVRREWAVR